MEEIQHYKLYTTPIYTQYLRMYTTNTHTLRNTDTHVPSEAVDTQTQVQYVYKTIFRKYVC